MNAARWSLIILLAAIGAGALTLSASSTLQLATTAGVEHVQVAAIAVLELASVVGTVMWLRAESRRARAEAAVLVVGASFVTAIGGLGAYGLFGLVGPIFLVASVHVASQEWRKPATSSDQQDNQDDQPVVAPVVVEAWSGPETVELPRLADTRAVEATTSDDHLDQIDWSQSERKLAMQLGVKRHTARQLKKERTSEVAS